MIWAIIWVVISLSGKRDMRDANRDGRGERGEVSEFSVEELTLRCLRSIRVEMPEIHAFLLAFVRRGEGYRKYECNHFLTATMYLALR